MTALVFGVSEQNVWLATDSLSLTTGGKPHKYVSKIFPLPHLSAVMVGTGDLNIVLEWFTVIQMSVVAQSFLYLNTIGPEQLPVIAEKHEHLNAGTTTIYHFGYDESLGRFRGFALRSTRSYEPDELIYGVGIKPYGEELAAGLTDGSLDPPSEELIVRFIEQQKRRDESLGPEQRLGVGGEVHMILLNQDGQFLWRCHRFADYDAVFGEMLDNLRASGEPNP